MDEKFELNLDGDATILDSEKDMSTSEDEGAIDTSTDKDKGLSVADKEVNSLVNPHEWASELDESLKKSVSLHKFKDVKSLAKAYTELEKGQGRSPFPGPQSTEEERIAFFRKAGVPDVDKYELNSEKFGLGEDISNELKEIASKGGVTPAALDGVLSYITEKSAIHDQDAIEKNLATSKAQLEDLKSAYGNAFDKYLKLGGSVAKDIYTPDELKAIKESGMSKNPLFVKVLMDRARSKYGEELIEDDHTKQNFVATPEAIEKRIGEIRGDSDYQDSKSSRYGTLVKEMETLYKIKSQTA